MTLDSSRVQNALETEIKSFTDAWKDEWELINHTNLFITKYNNAYLVIERE